MAYYEGAADHVFKVEEDAHRPGAAPVAPTADLFPAFDSAGVDFVPVFSTSAAAPKLDNYALCDLLSDSHMDESGATNATAATMPPPSVTMGNANPARAPLPANELFGGSFVPNADPMTRRPAAFGAMPAVPPAFDYYASSAPDTAFHNVPMDHVQARPPQPQNKPSARAPMSAPSRPTPKTSKSKEKQAQAAARDALVMENPIMLERVPKKPRSRRTKLTPEEREARRKQRLMLRRQRKSVREKARRGKENDYYEELADLVGLPKDNRDKATILEAVIQAIEEDGGEAPPEMHARMNEALADREPQAAGPVPRLEHAQDSLEPIPMDWHESPHIKIEPPGRNDEDVMVFHEGDGGSSSQAANIASGALAPPSLLAPPMPATASDLPPPISF